MSIDRRKFVELERLLGRLCDDCADAQDLNRLQELAQASPEAMRFYIDFLDQHAHLLWRFGRGAKADQTPILGVVDGATEYALPTADGEASSYPGDALSDSAISIHRSEGDSRRNARGTFPYITPPFSMVAAVAVGVMAFLGYMFIPSLQFRPGSDSQHAPVGLAQGQVKSVQSAPAGLAQGQVKSIKQESGVTTLSLEKIGTVTIEGPADFELLDPLRARLNRGRIAVHVTEATGHGFVVETPDGDVTDFGTRFTLDVSQGRDTNLIVREGAVDLCTGGVQDRGDPERLTEGEAVSFNATGNVQRIMSIVGSEADGSESTSKKAKPLISQVVDNLKAGKTKRYYEILPKGLRDDALAYVDRKYEWNSIDGHGIPNYLIGADYVKGFNVDKISANVEITVTLSRPATLFVFFDKRLSVPDWLVKSFEDTGDLIGLDIEPKEKHESRPDGTTRFVRPYSVWKQTVDRSDTVRLGSNGSDTSKSAMYGIAAVELPAAQSSSPPSSKAEDESTATEGASQAKN